jgi:hypothetical protein
MLLSGRETGTRQMVEVMYSSVKIMHFVVQFLFSTVLRILLASLRVEMPMETSEC